MCGIIAYDGEEPAAPILVEGLKRLEYRGYDSAGVLTLNSDSKFEIKKDIGKVLEIQERLNFLDLQGNEGIAHTRWATHGGVTQENAHPQVSNNGRIAVIHNGIIENYKELKAQLMSQGFHFSSETDTEVVPNLIEYWMTIRGVDFLQAVMNSFQSLEGNFALVVLDRDSGTIVGSKNGSPLVLGIGKNDDFFLASDIPAFIDHTKDVVYLYDGDTVIITQAAGKRSYKIVNFRTGILVERPIQSVSWDI